MMSEAAGTKRSLTISPAALAAISQRGLLMICSVTNMDAGVTGDISWWISILFTASWWSHPCLAASWRMHFSTPPVYIYGNFKQHSIHFCCVKACSSTFYSSPAKRYASAWIMHKSVLPVLFGPSLIQKMFCCCPAFTFSRSLTNRKRLVNGCRATGLSLNAKHYFRRTAASYWSCMGSCTSTCHPVICTTSVSTRVTAVFCCLKWFF